jgi:hypothetical protein
MCEVTYKGKPIKITIYLSEETLTAKRAWNDEFQALKENNSQRRILHPAKPFFIIEGQKSFHDKQKHKAVYDH